MIRKPRLTAVIVVGPICPGSEHHDGAPDEHDEFHDPQAIPGNNGALSSVHNDTTLEDCEIRCEDDISK